MNIQKIFFIIFFCTHILNTTTATAAKIAQKSNNNLTRIITHQQEHLLYLLEQTQKYNIQDNLSALSYIKQLQTELENLPLKYTTDKNTEELAHALHTLANTAIILDSGLQKKFINWQPIITRTEKLLVPEKSKSNAELKQEINELKKKIAELDATIALAHLSPLQRSYKAICTLLSRNNITRENTQKALTISAIAAFTYAAYYFSHRDASGKINPPKWLYALSAVLVGQVFKNDFIRAYHWCAQHAINAHYKLQGHSPITDLIKTYPTNSLKEIYGNTLNKKTAKKNYRLF